MICPKCFENEYLEKHHILPKCHFGKKNYKLSICHCCHKELHKLLPARKLKAGEYFEITQAWLKGKEVMVVK